MTNQGYPSSIKINAGILPGCFQVLNAVAMSEKKERVRIVDSFFSE